MFAFVNQRCPEKIALGGASIAILTTSLFLTLPSGQSGLDFGLEPR